MRNSNFLTKPVGPFLEFLTNMCAYQINSHFIVRTWHNLNRNKIKKKKEIKLSFVSWGGNVSTHNISMSSCWINKVVIRRFHISQISARANKISASMMNVEGEPTDQGCP